MCIHLVARHAISQLHRKLLAAKGERQRFCLGDADNPWKQKGGAVVAVADRPQLQDMGSDVHHNILHPVAVTCLLVDVAKEHDKGARL